MTIEDIADRCSNFLQSEKFENLPFHNLNHAQEVNDKVFLISNAMIIQQEEAGFIAIAACFHNTGFSESYDEVMKLASD